MTTGSSNSFNLDYPQARFLAVDIRPRSIGFVAVENASVIDSGTRICDQDQFDDCLGHRFDRLLQLYAPKAVILRDTRCISGDFKKRKIVTAIRQGAKRRTIDLVSVRLATVHEYFRRHDARTKYQIAVVVASLLPELAWKLPRKRKPWESEHYRMSIFDAAALLITHLEL
jgi:hypothetical protein